MSPTFNTSSTLSMRSLAICEMCTSASLPGNNSTKAPYFSIRLTVPLYTSPTTASRVISSMILRAFSIASLSTAPINIVPSCSISNLTPFHQ